MGFETGREGGLGDLSVCPRGWEAGFSLVIALPNFTGGSSRMTPPERLNWPLSSSAHPPAEARA